MPRRTVAALLTVAGASLLLACRPNTVELRFQQEVGATYRYRYVIETTLTRTVEGEAARTTELTVTVHSTQKVLEVTDEGARVEVTLTSSSSPTPSTATVQVDRAGSLQAIQQIDGLPAESAGLSTDALLAAAATTTPDRPLAVGDRWDIREGTITGDGRLDRLGVIDDRDVAVVETSLLEAFNATKESGGSQVVLDGDLHTSAVTAFDLIDGSVREGRTRSAGAVDVLVAPPEGVVAPAVDALVIYELRVTTTREG
ncbi:MAG: hypothetical protein ACJ739_01085 [Acidimicrobiales bacterium]